MTSPPPNSRRTQYRRRNVDKRRRERLDFALELSQMADRAPDDDARRALNREVARLREKSGSKTVENEKAIVRALTVWQELTTAEVVSETGRSRDIVNETLARMLSKDRPLITGREGNSGRRGTQMVWSLLRKP
jgi:hypothetical protein